MKITALEMSAKYSGRAFLHSKMYVTENSNKYHRYSEEQINI